jgi:hypothetical protein
MNVLVGFIPFAAFAVLDSWLGTALALAVASALAGIAAARDRLRRRSAKLLDLGAFVLFGALAVVTLASGHEPGVLAVRARVDAGILAIVVLSLAVGRPFTLDYAKERVPESVWGRPEFLAVNNRITRVWAGAFAAMLGADLAMLYVAACPLWLGIAVSVGALAAAAYATTVIPRRARAAA